jgi:DNA polymerase
MDAATGMGYEKVALHRDYTGGEETYLLYMTVPNSFPSIATNKYRIAVIGEAPGRDEEVMGKPFVGASGKLLKDILGKVGLPSDTLFFGNICQHRPLNNEIENFAWDSYEIQSGLEQLAKDLEAYQPHLCILLGKTALFAATNRSDITNQRGSVFIASSTHTPFTGRKCLATYHPAAILRVYESFVKQPKKWQLVFQTWKGVSAARILKGM